MFYELRWIFYLLFGFGKKFIPLEKYVRDDDIFGTEESGVSVVGNGRDLSVNIRERRVTNFFQKYTLLRDLHLTIPTGHMVLLLGGSGAGKTAFLNAVTGYEKANADIELGQWNVYRDYEKMKYDIGFVPQQDLMRGNDTVYRTIADAASLRKMLPMAAIIASLVAYVISPTLFVSMRGTITGSFGLTCICIWNGGFNSIQAICRERPIVNREHRAGLHMTSYIAAHMIYQLFICICQTFIILIILRIANVDLPSVSYATGNTWGDLGITLLLTEYAADMIALFVSAIVRNSTTAMTVMPFIMIFQLVFSGGFFSLKGFAYTITDFAVSKWGLNAVCAVGEYNSLPNDMIITTLEKMDTSRLYLDEQESFLLSADQDESDAALTQALTSFKSILSDPENRETIAKKFGEMSYNNSFASTSENILSSWLNIACQIVIFASASVIALEFIDKDKR